MLTFFRSRCITIGRRHQAFFLDIAVVPPIAPIGIEHDRIGTFKLFANFSVTKCAVAQVSKSARARTNSFFEFFTRTIALIINCDGGAYATVDSEMFDSQLLL